MGVVQPTISESAITNVMQNKINGRFFSFGFLKKRTAIKINRMYNRFSTAANSWRIFSDSQINGRKSVLKTAVGAANKASQNVEILGMGMVLTSPISLAIL